MQLPFDTDHARGALSCVCGMLLTLVAAQPALGHARLVRVQPADQAKLTRAPTQIDLWFSELLDEGFNTVTLSPVVRSGITKSDVTTLDAVLDAHDRTHLIVPLRLIAPGAYLIEWHVLSRDGHSTGGRVRFRVRGNN